MCDRINKTVRTTNPKAGGLGGPRRRLTETKQISLWAALQIPNNIHVQTFIDTKNNGYKWWPTTVSVVMVWCFAGKGGSGDGEDRLLTRTIQQCQKLSHKNSWWFLPTLNCQGAPPNSLNSIRHKTKKKTQRRTTRFLLRVWAHEARDSIRGAPPSFEYVHIVNVCGIFLPH